jgi:VWFA-related protein
MMRWILGVTAVATVIGHPSAQVVFRSNVNSVSVDVTVLQRGREVANLQATDFDLLDNGLPQRIVDISREALPVDVTFVVDQSGSVNGRLQEAIRRAIAAVGDRLRAIDRAAVIEFNHRVRETRPMAPSTPPWALALGRPVGSTALFDAITVALVAPPEPGRRRMAIVFTDGRDDASFADAESIAAMAERAQSAVFTVAVADGTLRRPGRAAHAALFSALATATGGTAVVMQQDEDLAASFVRAFDEFRTSYVLRYAYDGPATAGWHAITVRVTRPGTFDVRARPGYFVGP